MESIVLRPRAGLARHSRICGVLLLLVQAACSRTPPVPEKRYPMQGEIVALEPHSKSAIIRAGKIGDWMGPMTMDYPIEPSSEYEHLQVGEHIQGTVVVQGDKFYITGIQAAPSPAAK